MTVKITKPEINVREKLTEIEGSHKNHYHTQRVAQYRLTTSFVTSNTGGDYGTGGQVIKNNWEAVPGLESGVVTLQSDHFRIEEDGLYRIDYSFVVYDGTTSAWDQWDIWIGEITTGSLDPFAQTFGYFQYDTQDNTGNRSTAGSRTVYGIRRLNAGSKIQVGYGISNTCAGFNVRGRESLNGYTATRTNVLFTKIGE
jgi:hypothetical protein